MGGGEWIDKTKCFLALMLQLKVDMYESVML